MTVRILRSVILALIIFIGAVGSAQPLEQTASAVSIPNLAGLTPPQAAAALNAARLQLGSQSSATATAPQLPGTITGQIPAAGSTISPGAAVDVVIAYAPNIRLIYDNNDLTIINIGAQPLDVRTIDLQASDAVPVSFDGQRWGRQVEPTDCVQVWSTRRTQPKSLAECRRIEAWLSTTDPSQHVWKESAGVQHFVVRQDGVARGECPAAGAGTRGNPLVCEIYLEQAQPAPVWPFIYLAYTRDTLVVHNTSGDRWMRLNATVTPASGGMFSFNDISLYRAIDGLVVNNGNDGSVLRQLAPSQCVRFRPANAPISTLPEPCLIFADALIDGVPFWHTPFTIEDSSGDKHVCGAAMPDVVTTCRVLR
jgi:hypothetical protein